MQFSRTPFKTRLVIVSVYMVDVYGTRELQVLEVTFNIILQQIWPLPYV